MTKITLPALLRNGYSAVSFYQSHGITIASCNGFDADAILPENAAIAHQGKKTKLYVNNQLIGCFDTSEYKIRFDSTKAVAVPKKPKPADIVDTAKVEKAARPQKTTIVNVVSSSPAPSEKPQITPQINTPAPVAKTDAPPREKKVRKVSVPTEAARRYDDTKKLLFGMDSKIQLLMNERITRQEIADRLGVSRSTLMAYTKEKGIYPAPIVKPPRKRRVLLSKEQWEALLAEHGKSMIKIAKAAKCSKATVQRQLLEHGVPFELWRKQTKIKNANISLDKHYWVGLYKQFSGDFNAIAKHLKCKPSTARTYYYNSGAARITAKEPRVVGERKKRTYKPASQRESRKANKLKDKVIWEQLAQEHGTVKNIATAIGKLVDTCYSYIKKYVSPEIWKKGKTGIGTDKEFWLSMYEKHGKNWQAIADETGLSPNTAKVYMRESGASADINQAIADAKPLPTVAVAVDKRKYPSFKLEANQQAIIDMMNQGATTTSIRKQFNTHYTTVLAFLARPEVASQIHYVKPKGSASYEIRQLHPKEKILAATSQTKTISKLSAMLSIDKRIIKQLMVAYEIPFKK